MTTILVLIIIFAMAEKIILLACLLFDDYIGTKKTFICDLLIPFHWIGRTIVRKFLKL